VFGIIIFTLFSCAPRKILSTQPLKETPGGNLFLKADDKFEDKLYVQALELYTDFIRMYPESELAPAALSKIGAIQSSTGDYENARKTLRRIISEYPDSALVPDAMIDTLSIYYKEGRYQDIIDYSIEIDGESLSDNLKFRRNAIIADTYMSMEQYQHAVYVFWDMHNNASNEEEKERILEKINKIVEEMDSQEVASLLYGADDVSLKGFLMYTLGLTYASEGKPEKAIEALSELISNYPDNESVPNAVVLIEIYKESSNYEKFTIGCLLPISGKYEAFGRKALRGVELALDYYIYLNPDTQIRIIIKDTGGDPDVAAHAVEEMAGEGVAAIIGPILTAQAAAEVAETEGIPMIALTQKDGITDIGGYVFRNFLTPKMQVKATVSYAINELNLERFAILYPEEKYGTKYMNLFWDEVNAYGGEVVGVESYAPDSSDFADSIKKLSGLYYDVPEELQSEEELAERNSNPDGKPFKKEAIVDFDALFIPEGPEKASLILPQLTYHDITGVHLLGTNLWHSEKLISAAGNHVEGAIMPDIFFSGSEAPEVKKFVTDYQSMFAEEPGFLEALSYDTALILFDIVSRPEISFRMLIKKELMNSKPFSGATGLTHFGPDGDVLKKLFLLKIYGGRFVELEHTLESNELNIHTYQD